MSLVTVATVSDVVTEFNGVGSGPYTLFNVAGVTSGQIFDKISEANMYLQSMVGKGGVSYSGNAYLQEQVKRFEVAYGSARLAADLIGINITDGFNYNVGGLAVQRQGAQWQAFKEFIDSHMAIAKGYLTAFHQWFWVFSPDNPTGYRENGSPENYWAVANPRYT